ncbi:hypothetical protein B0T18DRAFT_484101 [Schizothecium vesticola]|uniref:Uncharacterized protein n=1 Tax=Schizothecium vesticola TaxID=314040 RepID=A0AA40F8S4_9PEZI|nr:hypothetical protein B0T18DRAFT_484101 [Schizothecium vesticola]
MARDRRRDENPVRYCWKLRLRVAERERQAGNRPGSDAPVLGGIHLGASETNGPAPIERGVEAGRIQSLVKASVASAIWHLDGDACRLRGPGRLDRGRPKKKKREGTRRDVEEEQDAECSRAGIPHKHLGSIEHESWFRRDMLDRSRVQLQYSCALFLLRRHNTGRLGMVTGSRPSASNHPRGTSPFPRAEAASVPSAARFWQVITGDKVFFVPRLEPPSRLRRRRHHRILLSSTVTTLAAWNLKCRACHVKTQPRTSGAAPQREPMQGQAGGPRAGGAGDGDDDRAHADALS